MSAWMILTRLGDSNVTLPVAAGIFGWLLAGRARRLAFWWALLFGGGLALVAATKIAFIGWGIGIRALDFTGISGHAMRAAAALPVVLCLLPIGHSRPIRITGVAAGFAAGALISLSRITVHAHSPSEAFVGWLLGTVIAIGFLRISLQREKPQAYRWIIMLSLLAMLPASFAAPAPTELWVRRVALYLSGHDKPYTRQNWQND